MPVTGFIKVPTRMFIKPPIKTLISTSIKYQNKKENYHSYEG
jgi:hypothetical protein